MQLQRAAVAKAEETSLRCIFFAARSGMTDQGCRCSCNAGHGSALLAESSTHVPISSGTAAVEEEVWEGRTHVDAAGRRPQDHLPQMPRASSRSIGKATEIGFGSTRPAGNPGCDHLRYWDLNQK